MTSIDDLTSPDTTISAKDIFGLDNDIEVPAFGDRCDHVPEVDDTYQFHGPTTRAILAGFMHNRRVLIQGYHGTGKSTHIEQIAARLNWPCIRINLDSHISRIDLIGKDALVIRDGQQITEFQEGILPWAIRRPCAIVFDEYDAGRPDVMFVIQRVLEAQGKLTLLDRQEVITPHPNFRIFATSNTIGLGDMSGLYQGTQQINQGQMDRWNIVANLNYLSVEKEIEIVAAKITDMDDQDGRQQIKQMVALANMTRTGFKAGDISTVMSPRTVITWAQNWQIFGDREDAFRLTFLNKCDEIERPVIGEYYQRCFDVDLETSRGIDLPSGGADESDIQLKAAQ